jgi:hypothetical protein
VARDAGVLAVRRVACLARRHSWVTKRDVAGPVTACSRCGALRHVRVESVAHGSFKCHTDLAAEFEPLPSHGPEELDVEQP